MDELLKQLEEQSRKVSLASGRKLANEIARGLEAYSQIFQRVKDLPRESIKILEKVEEVTSRQVDERYANPNDEYVFTLLLLLKDLHNKGIDDSSAFNIAKDCAEKMTNSFWCRTVRHNNLIENIYDMCKVSRADAIDELYCTIPEMFGAKQFGVVDQILVDMDVQRLHNSILYCIVNMTSAYVDYLPHYKEFWQRVYDEFHRRRNEPEADKDQVRTPEQIERLLGRFRDGPPILSHKYNPDNDNRVHKSIEERWTEKIEAKITWALRIGDKDLADMLKYYKLERARNQKPQNEYHKIRARIGEREFVRRTAEALRAMADKIEQPGMHFIVGADLPELPIFSGKDHVERYASHIEVTIVAGPLGG